MREGRCWDAVRGEGGGEGRPGCSRPDLVPTPRRLHVPLPFPSQPSSPPPAIHQRPSLSFSHSLSLHSSSSNSSSNSSSSSSTTLPTSSFSDPDGGGGRRRRNKRQEWRKEDRGRNEGERERDGEKEKAKHFQTSPRLFLPASAGSGSSLPAAQTEPAIRASSTGSFQTHSLSLPLSPAHARHVDVHFIKIVILLTTTIITTTTTIC